MKRVGRRLFVVFALWLAMVPPVPAATGDRESGTPPVMPVSPGVLQAKITEAEGDPDLSGEAKGKLLARYREALSNLNEVDANRAKAVAYEESARSAPEQAVRIRARIEAARGMRAGEVLDASGETPLQQLEMRLMREEADRAATEVQRTDLDRQLTYQALRPAAVRQRLIGAQEEQAMIAAALQTESGGDQGRAFDQARRWALETRYLALSTEISALDQEVISLPMRLDLLRAKQGEAVVELQWREKRVEALTALINARRTEESGLAQAAAERRIRETAGSDPRIRDLAQGNLVLTNELKGIAARFEGLDKEWEQAERLLARISAYHKREQAAVETGGGVEGLGQLLLEHRASLPPELQVHARRVRELGGQIATVNLGHLRHLEEASGIADLDAAVAGLTAKLPPEEASRLQGQPRDLLAQRQDLLDQQLQVEGQYLERLRKLQATEARLVEALRAYDAFLEEHLFWLGTGAPTRVADLGDLPEEVWRLQSFLGWSKLERPIVQQVATSPLLWLSLVLAAGLLWKRHALTEGIAVTLTEVGNSGSDRIGYSLRALGLTALGAAPFPLLLGAVGGLLLGAAQGPAASHALGASLVRVAPTLYLLLLFRWVCLPSGLAIGHFQWPAAEVARLGSELRWLSWVLVPAALLGRLAEDLNPVTTGGLVARLAMTVGALALVLFFYRVFRLKRGLLAPLRVRPAVGPLVRTQAIWFPLLLTSPLVVLVATLSGYVYSGVILTASLLFTLWLIVALLLLYGLGLRWLTLTRRRLAYEAALERRQAALAADANEAPSFDPLAEYSDGALDEATEKSRELLRIGIAVIGLAGLYLIWSSVLPALGILNEVTLWHRSEVLGGEERVLPVTLGDLALALVYLLAMTLLAKRLPAVLDMILLERFAMPSSSRYTATTLTTYAIVTLGTLLALHTLGAQWSQLQWLAAALGVGIGFGLQEIVANFISGLIILFERPIRVGDTVTVGGTDGVVTKIRIRATTIRNPERKELLVPNKEFITGRLLNWSLSDKITRVMITLGVAYGTDVEQAHALMRAAAEEHPHVLKDPKPVLTFDGFGDNALTLSLRAYVDDIDHRTATLTELHKAVNRKFEEAGISMPFPQRHLHLDNREPVRVAIEPARPGRPDGLGPA